MSGSQHIESIRFQQSIQRGVYGQSSQPETKRPEMKRPEASMRFFNGQRQWKQFEFVYWRQFVVRFHVEDAASSAPRIPDNKQNRKRRRREAKVIGARKVLETKRSTTRPE